MTKIDPNTLTDEQRKALKAIKDERDRRFQQEKKRHQVVIILLLVVVVLLSIRDGGISKTGVLLPDFSLLENDPYAFPSGQNTSQTDGAIALAYSNKISYHVDENLVSLLYTNNSASTSAAVLQIIGYASDGSEYLLAQSGMIKPGYSLNALECVKKVKLDSGSHAGIMRVLFYDEARGERAVVTTDIPVAIFVQ